ncbi:MAG: ribosomal protein S18 acetylase RimI-like enzyme, partial [Myxococcota bacterium]
KEITDKGLLYRFLIKDRIERAYHLGDLDPAYFGYCKWWGVLDDTGELEALVLLYTGLRTPAVLTLGSSEAVELVLESAEVTAALPDRFYVHLLPGHLAAIQNTFEVDALRQMVRMGLTRDTFVPTDEDLSGVRSVGHADTAALVSLYRFYPDNFFEPYQLESGFYFGSSEDDQLVAVAGVHIFSEEFDVVALGNIVTHPDFRSRGHSRRTTTRLLQALFERVSVAALNVQRDNVAARRVYERLGFVDHVRYLEGPVKRR